MRIKRFNNIKYCPYIKTEETIFELLERDSHKISDEYELIKLPLAHLINTIGIEMTNRTINSIHSTKRRVFVCQHIFVNKLSFKENDIVFTPHVSIGERYIPIPHYTVNYNPVYIKKDKDILFSFMGSVTTHRTRKNLVEMYPQTCFDSGKHWGLENKDTLFNNKYTELLGRSKYSLCPRGTGISSVRIFESMVMGSFPVFIANGYVPPLHDIIDWDSISISIDENYISKIHSILECSNLNQEKLSDTYNEYLANDKLHISIIKKLI